MEFCENGDLASVIRKYKRSGKKMEEHKIWSILFQLTCALHECHNRKDKILHRDIKVPPSPLSLSSPAAVLSRCFNNVGGDANLRPARKPGQTRHLAAS